MENEHGEFEGIFKCEYDYDTLLFNYIPPYNSRQLEPSGKYYIKNKEPEELWIAMIAQPAPFLYRLKKGLQYIFKGGREWTKEIAFRSKKMDAFFKFIDELKEFRKNAIEDFEKEEREGKENIIKQIANPQLEGSSI